MYRVQIAAASTLPGTADQVDDDDDESHPTAYAVVTLSDIGLTAKQVRGGLVVWATSIRTAQPLANIHLRAFSNKNQPLGEAITDATGLARIDNLHPADGESLAVILADRAPPRRLASSAPPLPQQIPPRYPAMTQPGLPFAAATGRWATSTPAASPISAPATKPSATPTAASTAPAKPSTSAPSSVTPINTPPAITGGFPVHWQLRRPDDRNWQSQVVMLDADGAAAFDAKLLPDLPTGQWTATLSLPGDDKSDRPLGSVTFNVEEFVPARMKVKLSFDESPRASLAGGSIAAQVQADYLFGRPAAGLTTELATHVEPIAFDPPGWDGWSFGDTAELRNGPAPRLTRHGRHHRSDDDTDHPTPTEVKLDNAGHYAWSIDAASAIGIDPGINIGATDAYAGPWRLTASAGVREAGGRAVTAVQHIDIDALPAYLALRRGDAGEDGDATPGEPCPIHLRLVRPDGQQAGSNATVAMSLSRATWNCTLVWRDGRYQFDSTRVLEPIQSENVNLSDGKAEWSPTIPSDGEFIVTARDTATGAFTSINFNATDGRPWDDNISANPEHLDIRVLAPGPTPPRSGRIDSPTFRVGRSARVAIGSPFPGKLLLTVETDNIIHTQVIDMPTTHIVATIPITAACRPNAFVTATVVRAVDPNAKWQAHRAFGTARLRVDPADQTLHVAITAPTVMQPLQSMDIALAVTDPTGQPAANAAVTVAAVDEGICMLTDFPTPDPVAYFNSDRTLAVQSSDVFDMLMPEVPDGERAVGGDRSTLARHISPIVAGGLCRSHSPGTPSTPTPPAWPAPAFRYRNSKADCA